MKFITVSQAGPAEHKYTANGETKPQQKTGGLSSGLIPVLKDMNGVWVHRARGDADMASVDENGEYTLPAEDAPTDEQYTQRILGLTDEQEDGFYYGFSNEGIWPVSHSMPYYMDDVADDFPLYEDVNQKLTGAAMEYVEDPSEDVLMVNDYHMLPSPKIARDEFGDELTIGFFEHIPVPEYDHFSLLPEHEELVHGVSGADLIGVHTERDVQNLLDIVEQTGIDPDPDWENGTYEHDGRTITVSAIPIGIDYDRFANMDASNFGTELRRELGADIMSFGLDRADYTKGILERLDGIETYLKNNPEMEDRFVHVQKSTPTRSTIPIYDMNQEAIEDKGAEINQKYGGSDHDPIHMIDDFLQHEDMISLYETADIGLITPINDGMNLVAKEFTAANYNGPNDGVLILSEGAGFAQQLRSEVDDLDDTLLIDMEQQDYDERVADAIHHSVAMSDTERENMMAPINSVVEDKDSDKWTDEYLSQLTAANRNK